MPRLTIDVSQSLMDALTEHCAKTGEPVRHFVACALSDELGLDHATLFQVSTAGALVQGVHNKATTVGDLKTHGDFGLGTFEGLDGEMIVVDGHFFHAHPDGSVTVAADSAPVPYAVVTGFHAQHRATLAGVASFDALAADLDRMRRSDNLFFAVRLDGRFEEVHMRVACKVADGVSLTEAAAHQAEFRLHDTEGTVVGFWSPTFTRSIAVTGWHLHFLSADRRQGGHLLGCRAVTLEAQTQDLDDLRLAIPETRQFLHADLTGDPSAALAKAERA